MDFDDQTLHQIWLHDKQLHAMLWQVLVDGMDNSCNVSCGCFLEHIDEFV